eukprot:COSAG01_NODE_5638_length_4125_cov_33.364382_5_plen_33_part_01
MLVMIFATEIALPLIEVAHLRVAIALAALAAPV